MALVGLDPFEVDTRGNVDAFRDRSAMEQFEQGGAVHGEAMPSMAERGIANIQHDALGRLHAAKQAIDACA